MNGVVLLRQVIFVLKRNKLRSLLAMLGIVWGTLSVVLLQAVGQGFYSSSQDQISSISNGIVYVYPGTTSKPYEGLPIGRQIKIRMSDLQDLAKHVGLIKSWSPQLSSYTSHMVASYEQHTRAIQDIGIKPAYFATKSMGLKPGGRNFNGNDIAASARVAIIGFKLKKYLFQDHTAVGKVMRLSGIPFRIIGILSDKKGGFAADMEAMNVFLPYSAYIQIHGNQPVTSLLILPKDKSQSVELIDALRMYFSHKLHYADDDKNALFMPNLAEATSFFNGFFFAIQAFLLFAGTMTLAVGGVGVANIMYLIVQERTFEIGLQMALGARDRYILLQMLLEAFCLVLFGGVFGYLIAQGFVFMLGYLPLPSWVGHPHISGQTAGVTLVVLSVVALLAGWFPAKKASKLDPVRALEG